MIIGILLGIYFLVLALKGMRNPFWSLVGLISITMINPGELFSYFRVLQMEKIFVLLVFVSWMMHEKIVVPPISKKLLFFWGTMLVSIPFAFYKTGALGGFVAFFTIVLYHLMTINLVNTKERFQQILAVYVGLIGWICGGTLWGYTHGNLYAGGLRNGLERAQGLTSTGGDPNSLGVLLVATMPLVGLLVIGGTKSQKLLGAIVMLMSVVSVVLTGSRGSFVTMLVLAAAVTFTSKRGILMVPVFIALLIPAWTLLPDNIKDRYLKVSNVLDSKDNKEVDESYMSRVYARQAGWQMFLDHPLTGVGAGVFKTANGSKYWPGPGRRLWLQPHNLYVQLLAELGIIGTIAWLVFFYSLVKTALACRRIFKAGNHIDSLYQYFPKACLLGIFVLLVNGWTSHSLYNGLWYFLAALTGALWQMFGSEQQPRVLSMAASEIGATPAGAN